MPLSEVALTTAIHCMLDSQRLAYELDNQAHRSSPSLFSHINIHDLCPALVSCCLSHSVQRTAVDCTSSAGSCSKYLCDLVRKLCFPSLPILSGQLITLIR